MYKKWESACMYANWMQDWKDMKKRNIEPEIYWHVKVETKWGEMGYHEL